MLTLALLLAASQPLVVAPVRGTETLTKLLDEHDYIGLVKKLNTPSSEAAYGASLEWERNVMLMGASAFISFRYASDIWNLGNAQKRDEIKQTAAMAFLYGFAALTIDGKRCKDVSAPGHRWEQFAPAMRPILSYLRNLPVEDRRKLINLTMNLDGRTMASASRHADWFLCSGGIEEMGYGLAHGSQKPVPTPPGHLGTTILVDAKGYKPEFLSDSASEKLVTDQRSHLASGLAQMAGL